MSNSGLHLRARADLQKLPIGRGDEVTRHARRCARTAKLPYSAVPERGREELRGPEEHRAEAARDAELTHHRQHHHH